MIDMTQIVGKREVPEFPNYFVTTEGVIESGATGGRKPKGKGISIHKTGDCPPRARLKHVSGKYRSVSVARLVFESFVRKLDANETIGYHDGDIFNVALSNLTPVQKKRVQTFSCVDYHEAMGFVEMRSEGKTLMQISQKAARPYSTIARVLRKVTAN